MCEPSFPHGGEPTGLKWAARAAARVPGQRVLRIIGQGALRCPGRDIRFGIRTVASGRSSPPMISTSKLGPYAHYTLADAVIPELPGYYRGKVRENYDLRNGARILVATDRVSAFDRNLAVIPLKGQRSEEQRLNSSHSSISYAVFCLK